MPNWMTFLPVVPQLYLFSRLSWLLPKKLQMGREQARIELVGKTSNSNLGLGQSDILYKVGRCEYSTRPVLSSLPF